MGLRGVLRLSDSFLGKTAPWVSAFENGHRAGYGRQYAFPIARKSRRRNPWRAQLASRNDGFWRETTPPCP